MMRAAILRAAKAGAAIAALCLALPPRGAQAADAAGMRDIVTAAAAPLMRQYGIPGMAIGIIRNGHITVFDYGLASKSSFRPVNAGTLFEIGSISKTFNATLATYALGQNALDARGQNALEFSGMAAQYLPALRNSAFDHISLLDLATYTAGGLPLQVPDAISSNAQLTAYLKAWKPAYPPGTFRLYSNVSIGLFGVIAAASLHADYATLLQNRMFPAFGLHHSFMRIPGEEMENYAQGYEEDGTPIRMDAGMLSPEAYGVRITAADLSRFIAINMGMFRIDPVWQSAVTATHTGYDQTPAGGMIQDLGWESYKLPADLAKLQAGNAIKPGPVTALNPPLSPQPDLLLNKTGSTNGFAAYVAFIPAHRLGIVLLANRNYPIPARVAAAYEILSRLDANAMKR